MSAYQEARDILMIFTLSTARIMACFIIFPLLSKRMLGGVIIRNGVISTLGFFIYPIVANDLLHYDLNGVNLFAILLKEAMIGLMVGFCAALPLWAIESAGFFIDNQRGATLASNINPALETESSPVGILFTQTLITLFFVSGSFLVFIEGLFKSYISWSVVSYTPSFHLAGANFFMEQLTTCMKICVFTAAPVIIAMFLAEFGLALISRFAPSMNVFFLSLPIKSGVAVFLLIVYIGIFMNFFVDELFGLPQLFKELNRIWMP